jgi:hypothetical protein
MDDNKKVLIKNLMRYEVGFNCLNFPQRFYLQPGQVIGVRWEYLYDTAFSRGFRYLIENSYLKILPTNENYNEIMEELQFSHLAEKLENAMSYEDIKKLLSTVPLVTQYAVIKEKISKGSEATKKNFANAAIEIGMEDIAMNKVIKEATGIDVLKTLELKNAPQENKTEEEFPLV